MSVKKKMIIVTVIAVLVVAVFAVAFLATQKSADYYTQIDNDFVTEIPPHGSRFDFHGETKKKKEGRKRKLRDEPGGPFLCFLGVGGCRLVIVGLAEGEVVKGALLAEEEKYCEDL